MVLGLKEIQIRGEIRTNVDYTIDLLHVKSPHLVATQTCFNGFFFLEKAYSFQQN